MRLLLGLVFLLPLCAGRPQGSLVVTSTTPPTTTTHPHDTFDDLHPDQEDEKTKPAAVVDDNLKPVITEFHVRSDIQFRYAHTVVETYVKNPSSSARDVSFTVVLPEAAFVSNFSMHVQEKEYVAEVAKKAEAQQKFNEAVAAGQGAGLVNQNTRDASQITVQVNVEPRDKVRFRLTYEQLLKRRLGRYDHTLHVNPGQIVDDFVIDVYINESLPVVNVKVPELKTDPNAITSSKDNPLASVFRDPEDDSKVHIRYKPDRAQQQAVADNGVSGEFVVQYDVDRKDEQGEIQVLDGYFVHFFAPDQLQTLPKHVVFVLDVSGSMYGEKLRQTKDAMVTIIDDLTEQDYLNIITFSDDVYHWVPKEDKMKEGPHRLTYAGTEDIRNEALKHVLDLHTIGGTNINDGMLAGLDLVKNVLQAEEVPANTQPIVIFLTDGQATTGVTNGDQIKTNVAEKNLQLEVPIYGLAFGTGADFNLIKTLSVNNNAFARRIYEGSDAAIQLEDFYLEIASPLLSNLKFDYVGELVDNSSLTTSSFNTFNKGNEFVIAGKLNSNADENDIAEVDVLIAGQGKEGDFHRTRTICLPPPIWRPLPFPLPVILDDEGKAIQANGTQDTSPPIYPDHCYPIPWPRPHPPLPPPKPREPRSDAQNFIERLWAFMTINQLLDEKLSPLEERKEELTADEDEEDEDDSEEEDEVKKVSDEVVEDMKHLILPVPPKPPKTRKERAVDLALKYNFVTSVTSLVVLKPKPKAAEDNETQPETEPEKNVIEPTSVTDVARGGGGFGFGLGGGSRIVLSSFSGKRRPGPLASPPRRIVGGPPPPPVPMSAPGFPGQNFAPQMMFDADEDSFFGTTTRRAPTTTTTTRTSCFGSISLHGQTYLRGRNVTLDTDTADLATENFDNKLTSVEVRGNCCWLVYTDANFQGDSIMFREGESNSASDMGVAFRAASSVKRVVHC